MNRLDTGVEVANSVSVVVPVYNRAKVVSRAIESIASQSLQPIETLVIDDGSTDNLERIVRNYPWVTYLRLSANGGVGKARNYGVSLAKGEWVAFLDSDDAWHPEKLERQMAFARQNSDACLICHGLEVECLSGERNMYLPSLKSKLSISSVHTYPFSPSTWLMRSRVFFELGGFDESLPNCEDWDLLARIILNGRIGLMNESLVTKYNGLDGLDSDREKSRLSYSKILARYSRLWSEDPTGFSMNMRKLAHLHAQAGADKDARRVLWDLLKRYPLLWRSWLMWLLLYISPQFLSRDSLENTDISRKSQT